MNPLPVPFFAVVALALSACVAPQPSADRNLSERERLLVGNWTADIYFARWVITRRPDHMFTERAIRIYDYAKPAVRVESTGTWHIEGNRYCERSTWFSHPKWAPLQGRETCEDILVLTSSRLDYFPKDSPRISERKLSGAEAFWLLSRPLKLTGSHRHDPVEGKP